MINKESADGIVTIDSMDIMKRVLLLHGCHYQNYIRSNIMSNTNKLERIEIPKAYIDAMQIGYDENVCSECCLRGMNIYIDDNGQLTIACTTCPYYKKHIY